jgi:hypothetical protein
LYTSRYFLEFLCLCDFEGTLAEVLQLPLNTNFHRAVFVATLNAILDNLHQVEATVHCKDKEPALCAQELPTYIEKQYGKPKIAFIGFQPALIQALHDASFDLCVTDLTPDNIGQIRCGVRIDNAVLNTKNARWADIILFTGSVLVNDTYHELQQGKPLIYYGVTAAGLAKLFHLPRICFTTTESYLYPLSHLFALQFRAAQEKILYLFSCHFPPHGCIQQHQSVLRDALPKFHNLMPFPAYKTTNAPHPHRS